MEGYFKGVGKRHAWLSREQAMTCASTCQQFTENWRHGWKRTCLIQHEAAACILLQRAFGLCFASFMHALLFVHACPCIFMQNNACPCKPTCDHHACYTRGIPSRRQASLCTQGRSQCLECACGVLTVEAVQGQAKISHATGDWVAVIH